MPEIGMTVVDGPGVEAVVATINALQVIGNLDEAFEHMKWAREQQKKDGMSDCHGVSLALLKCLHRSRKTGWKIRVGTWEGPTLHSWLENGDVAVDGHMETVDEVPVMLVSPVSYYRESFKAAPRWTFTAQDVISGRYGRKMRRLTGSPKQSTR